MRFEISYQCDDAQYDFDKANPEVIYCFDEKALKQAKLISEAKKVWLWCFKRCKR